MSSQIHPTAIVDSTIDLGDEVRIGPFAVIEEGCVIEDHCEIQAHAVICKGTLMGPRNKIGYGTVIGADPQDLKFKGGRTWVELGAGNQIREYATIHRASTEGTATSIGNDNFIMSGVHIGHDCEVGDRTILANNTLLGGHVQIGDAAFLGGGTLVHQHVRIGRLVITRGGTVVLRDLPPYCMSTDVNEVSGINRLGLRRAGFSHETRRAIQAAYELLYRSNLNVTQALAEMKHKFHLPEILHLVEFIQASKRGICRGKVHSRDDEEE
jgi:UDP-N-acetylglucosamine acyltransferase